MNRGVLGVIAVKQIQQRADAAVTALRQGQTLTPAAAGQILTDLTRLIDSHETQAARLRAATLALDSNTRRRR